MLPSENWDVFPSLGDFYLDCSSPRPRRRPLHSDRINSHAPPQCAFHQMPQQSRKRRRLQGQVDRGQGIQELGLEEKRWTGVSEDEGKSRLWNFVMLRIRTGASVSWALKAQRDTFEVDPQNPQGLEVFTWITPWSKITLVNSLSAKWTNERRGSLACLRGSKESRSISVSSDPPLSRRLDVPLHFLPLQLVLWLRTYM